MNLQCAENGLPPPLETTDMTESKLQSHEHLLRLLAAEEDAGTVKSGDDADYQMATEQIDQMKSQLRDQIVSIGIL